MTKKAYKVCPKPAPLSNQTALIANRDLPGPSSALALTPNTYNDEVASDDSNQVSVQRRRKPRAEINLLYPCTMCDKTYASSQFLYQHKRAVHNDPPPAACNINWQANSKASGDERDNQDVRKHRKRSELN